MYLGSDNYLGSTAYLGEGGNITPDPEGDETLIQWRDLTLHGPVGRFTINALEGWEDLPDARTQWDPRPNQHGVFDAPVLSGERHVMVSGWCQSREQLSALLRELKQGMTFGPHAEQLTITHAGRTLSVAARLVRFQPGMDLWHSPSGYFPWVAEWVAPDPFRYGSKRMVYTTLPELKGGLNFDLFTDGEEPVGWLDFGEAGSSGRITLRNDGDADGYPEFTVRGPAPEGFTITNVQTGRRLVSTTVVPSGSALTIHTANGTAYLDGADRSGQLTVREWTPIPPGESYTFQFTAPTFTSATLVGSIRDTYF